MENRIRWLFDYQRFSPNDRLAKLIRETEGGGTALEDAELALVTAAGETAALNGSRLDLPEEKQDKGQG